MGKITIIATKGNTRMTVEILPIVVVVLMLITFLAVFWTGFAVGKWYDRFGRNDQDEPNYRELPIIQPLAAAQAVPTSQPTQRPAETPKPAQTVSPPSAVMPMPDPRRVREQRSQELQDVIDTLVAGTKEKSGPYVV